MLSIRRITSIMENQIGSQMENEMEAGVIFGLISTLIPKPNKNRSRGTLAFL